MWNKTLGTHLGLGLVLLLSACTSAVKEPEGAFVELTPRGHPFQVVWECLAEAAEQEGFKVERSQREGDERGEFETRYQVDKVNVIQGSEEALRLRVRMLKQGKRYGIQVAASRFVRSTAPNSAHVSSPTPHRSARRAPLTSPGPPFEIQITTQNQQTAQQSFDSLAPQTQAWK